MFYYLYEIKNNLNGKIYVGVHKTNNLDDGYMGSGKVINRAIAKHGVENFIKVILERFDTSAAMYAREKEVVTDDFLLREDVYNLRRGGQGGFDFINKTGINNKDHEESLPIRLDALKKGRDTQKRLGICNTKFLIPGFKSDEHRLKMIKNANSPEAILKKQATWEKTGRSKKEKNSQFGTMWITNDQENKKIKNSEPIPSGWRQGRII